MSDSDTRPVAVHASHDYAVVAIFRISRDDAERMWQEGKGKATLPEGVELVGVQLPGCLECGLRWHGGMSLPCAGPPMEETIPMTVPMGSRADRRANRADRRRSAREQRKRTEFKPDGPPLPSYVRLANGEIVGMPQR